MNDETEASVREVARLTHVRDQRAAHTEDLRREYVTAQHGLSEAESMLGNAQHQLQATIANDTTLGDQ